MLDNDIHNIIKILRIECKKWDDAIVTQYANISKNPFKILISTMLSLRTKDNVTHTATEKLFNEADTPKKILKLKVGEIEKLIYPVGFYKTKAKNIKDACNLINTKYNNKVPDSIEELLKIKGVGRKTANLVITLGYDKAGICVDTHVHRITNRIGYVNTKNPTKTEFALRKKLPKEYWRELNDLLVVYGQNLCRPISPFCSKCKISIYCKKIGVKINR